MVPSDRIGHFLAQARRRTRTLVALQVFALVSAGVAASFFLLAWAAMQTGPAAYWPTITTGVLLFGTLTFAALGVVLPALRLKTDTAVALLIGRKHLKIASDLRSAVELSEQPTNNNSKELVAALREQVGNALTRVAIAEVLPAKQTHLSFAVAGSVAVLLTLLAILAPDVMRRGLVLLLHTPTLYEGAAVSEEPLVADVKLTYTYPSYTKMGPKTVEGSTGDLQAIKGTKVDIEMRALRRVRRALLFFGDSGEGTPLEANVKDSLVRGSFVLNETSRYRLWLAPLIGRPVRESRGHRIEIIVDQPPAVSIKSASDRLELASPRPVEIGYSATDDFELSEVNLVFRVGNAPEKRVLLHEAGSKRQVQGSMMWDPSGESLVPGVEIAYHIEARDTDTVSGPKVGVSRTLYLVLERPRESTDESLEQQKFVQERLLGVLADRLETAGSAPGETPPNDQFTLWQAAHDEEAAQVALLAGVVDEQRRDGGASKTLLGALSKVADRLNHELKAESVLLRQLRPRADSARMVQSDLQPLARLAPAHIAMLEDVVLVLDDLIGRQRLEDLAGLGEQLTQAYDKLSDLLARYQNTKDEALKEQLMREMQALRKRIGDLAQKIAEVKSRNEVGNEWQNMPDTRAAMNKAKQLEDLLAKGDNDSLSKALEELGESLRSLKKMLNENADDFTGERFTKESKATAELTQKLSELEGDERQLAGDTRQLSEAMQRILKERQAKELAEQLKGVQEKLSKLKDTLQTPTPKRLGEDAADQQSQARDRVSSTEELLQRKDVVEARKQMDELSESMSPLTKQARQRAKKDDPNGSLGSFAKKMDEAEKLSDEIRASLLKLAPRDRDIANAEQRQQGQQLGERQKALAERARQLAAEARKAGNTPGFDQAAQGLEEVAGQMGQAQSDLNASDTTDALSKEQGAADRLSQLRESIKGEKMARGSRSPEPVRIPGVDDSKAPRAWREELIEAMKEKGPENFRDAVRRYYEELVK
jgi:hypothetical protein